MRRSCLKRLVEYSSRKIQLYETALLMDLFVICANAYHATLFLDTLSCFARKIHCNHTC